MAFIERSVVHKRMITFVILLGMVLFMVYMLDKHLGVQERFVWNQGKLNLTAGSDDYSEVVNDPRYQQLQLDLEGVIRHSNKKNRTEVLAKLRECINTIRSKETKNVVASIGKQQDSSVYTNILGSLARLTDKDKNTTGFKSVQNYVEKLRNQVESANKKPDIVNPKTGKGNEPGSSQDKQSTANIGKPGEVEKEGQDTKTQQNENALTVPTKDKPICDTMKYLIGKQDYKADITVEEVKDPAVIQRVKKGGAYTPDDCRPRDSVAIIIPYRDRQKHLEIFVNHIHAFLQRQQLQYGIFVVELARPTTFNRGLLANVGFLAAQSTGLYGCYVIHDVDLLPINDRNIYNCSAQLRHLSVANPKFNNGLPYQSYAGGVIALREDTYVRMNGFSNLYFGWGGEDDDVHSRAKDQKCKLERPAKEIGVYVALPHGKDALNPANPKRFNLVGSWKGRQYNDGLNSMYYQQLSLAPQDLYTLVYVKVNQTEVLKTDIISHVSDIQIYGSDLKTLGNKSAVNDKVINAAFWILQDKNKERISSMNTILKYTKKPWFPERVKSSAVELVFLPLKQCGHWTLIVIFSKQERMAYLDPTGKCRQKGVDLIRQEYQNQFNIDLKENIDLQKEVTLNEDENQSGILIILYAKRITEGKPLIFQQIDIDAARREIEIDLRR